MRKILQHGSGSCGRWWKTEANTFCCVLIGSVGRALALYKEGKGANSVFNRFLNYYKILDLAFPRWADAEAWICRTVPVRIQGREWLAQVPGNPAEYLRDSCGNAIAHVRRKPIVNPDSFHDNRRLERDERIMGYLAAELIRLGVFD